MARNVTLLQLRTDIQFQVDQVIGSSGHVQTTNVNRLINQSIQRFRERVSSEGMTRYLVSTSSTLTTGATSPYPFLVLDLSAISPALVRTYGVDITVQNTVKTLTHVPFTERANYGGIQSTAEPVAWSHFKGDHVAISPAPNLPYPYTVWYLPVLADLVADADTFDGVSGWEDFIVWDVVCRLIIRDQYAEEYQMASEYRDGIWKDILRGAQRVSASGGATIGRDAFGGRVRALRSPLATGSVSGGGGTNVAAGLQGALQYNNQGSVAGAYITTDGFSLSFLTAPTSVAPSNQYLSVPTGNMLAFGFSGVDGLRIFADAAAPSHISFQALSNSGRGHPSKFLTVDRSLASPSGLDLTVGDSVEVRDLSVNAARTLNLTAPAINLTGAVTFNPPLSFPTASASFNGITQSLAVTSLAFPTGTGDKLGSWTASGYANQATGIYVVSSGTALQFGAANTATGSIRFSNLQTVYSQKSDGSAPLRVLEMGDNLSLGDGFLNGALFYDVKPQGSHSFRMGFQAKATLSESSYLLASGIDLKVTKQAFPTGFGDRLGAWTPLGIGTQATGVYLVGSGTAIAFGPNPATAGAIRLSNNQNIYGLKTDGSANISLLTLATDNVVYVGDTIAAELDLQSSSNIDFDIAGATNPVYRFTKSSFVMGSGTSLTNTGGSLQMGTGPAGGGAIRLGNGNEIRARNAAGSGDLQLLRSDGNDNVFVGGDSTQNDTFLKVPSGKTIRLEVNAVDVTTVNSSGITMGSGTHLDVGAGGYIGFGTAPASAQGLVRTPSNNTLWMARNAANSGDAQLLKWDGSDQLVIGSNVVVGEFHQIAAGGQYDLKILATSEYNFNSTTADFKDNALISVGGLTMSSGTNIQVPGNGYIGFGSGAGQPTTGALRFPANYGLLIEAEAFDVSGTQDILQIGGSPTFTDLRIGDLSAKGTNSVYLQSKAQVIHAFGAAGAQSQVFNSSTITMGSGVYLNNTADLKLNAGGGFAQNFTFNQIVGARLTGTGLAYTNGATGYALTGVGTIAGADGIPRTVDWREPLRGTNLSDANATLTVGLGNRYLMASGVMTTGRTVTLIPTGATVGEVITIERIDTSASTLSITNGGPGGSGTIYTFPASTKRAADFIFGSATSWALGGHVRLT